MNKGNIPINNTVLKKGLFFTDLHFGVKQNSPVHNQDCLDYIHWLCDLYHKAGDIDFIAFLGDWYENRTAINIATMKFSHRAADLINNLGVPVYFAIGNHDLYNKHSRDIHSASFFQEFSNFNIIEQPTIINEVHNKLLMCPYMFHHEYPALSTFNDIPVWAGHFEFRDFVITGYNTKMDVGPDHTKFNQIKKIFSGHYHKRQMLDNICYIGNAFPTTFGDVNDDKRGAMIYDFVNDRFKFYDWDDAPTYRKVTVSHVLDHMDDDQPMFKSKGYVRCVDDQTMTYNEASVLRKVILDKYNLRDFEIQEALDIKAALTDTDTTVNANDGSNSDDAAAQLINIDDLVLKMLSDINVDGIDNKILAQEYKKLKMVSS